MPSRVESFARAVALMALGALLWRAWSPAAGSDGGAPVNAVVTTRALPQALARATDADPSPLDLTVDSLPGRREREWARAIAAAGSPLTWRRPASAATAALASVVEPVADPRGRARITALASPGATLTVRDAAGTLDSAAVASTGIRSIDATIDGPVHAQSAAGEAMSAARDSLILRPVLVFANAGWEGKFVTAALEEAGWRVDARFRVAPNADVSQGATVPIDTAHYAAVIALDSTAAPNAAAIARFARSGGGVIVARAAASIPALASLLPARRGETVAARLGAFASEAPRRALDGVALTAIDRHAVVLDRTGREARVVAARVEAGRIIVVGYDDTWRWRMAGDDEAPAAHRAWWSSLVSSVAYAPTVQLADVPVVDEAPYAALVDALGPPSPVNAGIARTGASLPWDTLLFGTFVLALLAEWSSRRLRGAR
ncbi:MAG: hypothetical protein U0164_24860 [Gemmatimonadaceae bacterium]